jgi:hypothetical protein
MKRIATTAGIIAAAAMTAFAAGDALNAQPGPRGGGAGSGRGPGMMMGPGMMGGGAMGYMCNPRSAGMAEWRASRIESAIKLTDAQKEALKRLTEASAKAAETISAACAASVPGNPGERLALMEKRTEASLQAIKLVRPAFDAFYASLDADQKARFDGLGPRRWGWDNWRRR